MGETYYSSWEEPEIWKGGRGWEGLDDKIWLPSPTNNTHVLFSSLGVKQFLMLNVVNFEIYMFSMNVSTILSFVPGVIFFEKGGGVMTTPLFAHES